ncbi:MAG: glycosyltransferase [Rhodothermales bacterium]
MKIGYFAHSKVGVSETFISDLMIALNKKAHSFSFFSGASAGTTVQGIPTHYTGYYDTPSRSSFLLYKVGQILGGRGDRMKFRYAQRSAVQIMQRYERHLAEIDVAFVDYGTSGALLYPLLEEKKIPMVMRVHAYDVTSAFANVSYRNAFLRACNFANCVLTVSDHIKRLLILAGVESSKIRLVRLGIGSRNVSVMPWDEKMKGPPSILHLGRLTPKKHPLALIHAFSIVKNNIEDAHLTIIGEGPLLNESKKRVAKLGLEEAVRFKGALAQKEAFGLMRRHWVFAQHSVTSMNGDQEGFPVSPAEAALHELPVVSTSHSGITENVIEGETGFLVQEHNYEEMAERMIHLLKHPEIAERMGKAGRQRILGICNPEIQTQKVYDLLEAAYAKNRLAFAGN